MRNSPEQQFDQWRVGSSALQKTVRNHIKNVHIYCCHNATGISQGIAARIQCVHLNDDTCIPISILYYIHCMIILLHLNNMLLMSQKKSSSLVLCEAMAGKPPAKWPPP